MLDRIDDETALTPATRLATNWRYNVKSTSLIICISLALSGTALAQQQSTGSQVGASGSVSASASADRQGAAAGGNAEGAAVASTEGDSAALAQDAELDATLSKSVDASKAKVGDPVTATLNQDIKSNGQVAIKKGSRLVGHVAAARPMSREHGSSDAKDNSELAIIFDRAVLKDGREIPLNATVQALAAAESSASAGMSDAHAGMGAAGSGAGSLRSGGRGLVGGVAGGAGGLARSGSSASAVALTKSAGAAGGLEGTGRFASGSRGVFGLRNIDLVPATNARGSVLTSSTGNVRLDRGTRMLLVNGGAASNASGAAQVTQGPR